MKNIVSTDNSVKRQITDSISENLTDSELENRYSNIVCVFWPSDYKYINMKESSILLVAIAIFIFRLSILYFWFNQFHLQYFDCCVQHAALFSETYYTWRERKKRSLVWKIDFRISIDSDSLKVALSSTKIKKIKKFPTYNRMVKTLEPFLSVQFKFVISRKMLVDFTQI